MVCLVCTKCKHFAYVARKKTSGFKVIRTWPCTATSPCKYLLKGKLRFLSGTPYGNAGYTYLSINSRRKKICNMCPERPDLHFFPPGMPQVSRPCLPAAANILLAV